MNQLLYLEECDSKGDASDDSQISFHFSGHHRETALNKNKTMQYIKHNSRHHSQDPSTSTPSVHPQRQLQTRKTHFLINPRFSSPTPTENQTFRGVEPHSIRTCSYTSVAACSRSLRLSGLQYLILQQLVGMPFSLK